jgi:hypothetical protein
MELEVGDILKISGAIYQVVHINATKSIKNPTITIMGLSGDYEAHYKSVLSDVRARKVRGENNIAKCLLMFRKHN